MPIVALLIFFLSATVAFFGLAQLTPATRGVGLIAIACYLGIVARLAQASGHLDAQRNELTRLRKATANPVVTAPAIWDTTKREVGPNEIQCTKCGCVSPRGPATCQQCGAKY